MLIQFNVKNYASFKNKICFDMTAVNSYKEHVYNLYDLGKSKKYNKVSVIYGANGSGKSNFAKAFSCFQQIIRESNDNKDNNDVGVLNNCYNPFTFTPKQDETEFEIVIIENNIEYRYGYSFNKDEIKSEWLYKRSINNGKQSIIFERLDNVFEFPMKSIKNKYYKYRNGIATDVLILSFFNRLNEKGIFKTVYEAICCILVYDFECDSILKDKWLVEKLFKHIPNNEFLNFLESIDADIKGVEYLENEDNKEKIDIIIKHVDKTNNSYSTPINNESDGTKKIICIYGFIRLAINNGKCVIIDELNNRLHPLLSKIVIDMFHKQDNKAQLIYTTHDTALLDKNIFRRDQIWFTEKIDSCSELYSLAEFKIRNDSSFAKSYLAGEYGAIPILKNFNI